MIVIVVSDCLAHAPCRNFWTFRNVDNVILGHYRCTLMGSNWISFRESYFGEGNINLLASIIITITDDHHTLYQ